MSKNIISWSFVNAVGTIIYVALVTLAMRIGGEIFGKVDNNFIGPIVFLLLFVLSATITASLILGRPIWWYLNNQKIDALKLFGLTLAWIAVFIVLFILTQLFIYGGV